MIMPDTKGYIDPSQMLSRFNDSYSTTIVVFVLCLCLLVNVSASKSPIVKIDYARLVIGDVVLQE